jgi:hypothetical protein
MATTQQRHWVAGAPDPQTRALAPAEPTAFERLTQKLGLHAAPHLWPHDQTLRRWVHVHKNSRYIPESLLAALDERVLED